MDLGTAQWYDIIRLTHIGCAVISICGFCMRAALRLHHSALLKQRWIKTTPHIVDTLLLISAIYLAVSSRQYPLHDDWLSAKVVGLLVYITMGLVLMRLAKKRTHQIIALIAALLSAAYIVAVAMSRNPLLFT